FAGELPATSPRGGGIQRQSGGVTAGDGAVEQRQVVRRRQDQKRQRIGPGQLQAQDPPRVLLRLGVTPLCQVRPRAQVQRLDVDELHAQEQRLVQRVPGGGQPRARVLADVE